MQASFCNGACIFFELAVSLIRTRFRDFLRVDRSLVIVGLIYFPH